MSSVKKKNIFLLILALGLLSAASGCRKREAADLYVKAQLENIPEEKSELIEQLFDKEVKKQNIENFPEDLREDYIVFLKEAYSRTEYEVEDEQSLGRHRYKVDVIVKPLNIQSTSASVNAKYLAAMETNDFSEAMHQAIRLNMEALDHPQYEDGQKISLHLIWNGDSYTIKKTGFETLAGVSLIHELTPYLDIWKVFDIQNYVKSCLDAEFMGDYAAYARQIGSTEEAVRNSLEEALWDSSMEEYGFSAEEKNQFIEAEKAIAGGVKYQVGTPREAGKNQYTLDITFTPNLALKECMESLNQQIEKGQIETTEALGRVWLTLIQEKAAKPSEGEPDTFAVHVMAGKGNRLQIAEEDYKSLRSLLLPSE